MRSLTHLGRSLSLDQPQHRIMLALCAAAALGALALPRGRAPVVAMVSSALTVFLVWALVRELDPDHPLAAVAGGGAAGAVTILAGQSSLAALAALMVTARIVVRSTGLRPLLSDIAVIGALAGIFARTPLVWAAGLGLAVGVAIDTTLPEPAPQRNVWLAGAIGVAVTLTAVLSDAVAGSWAPPGLVTVSLGLAGLVLIITARDRLQSTADYRPTSLHPERVRAARLLVAGALALGTLVGGAAQAAAIWAGWVGLLAAGAGSRWGQ